MSSGEDNRQPQPSHHSTPRFELEAMRVASVEGTLAAVRLFLESEEYPAASREMIRGAIRVGERRLAAYLN